MDDEDKLLDDILSETPTSTDAVEEPAEEKGTEPKEASKPADVDQKTDVDEAILFAKKYLEDLLSFFGLNTDIYGTTEDGEVIELDIPSTHLNGFLIGQRGETLRALQYTISNALRCNNFSHTRVNIDVAGYKAHRAERLAKDAEAWFKEVRDSGKPKELKPMNPADRRVVHKAAVDYGLQTESVGYGKDRHIVLKPAEGAEATPPEDKE